MEGRYRLIRDKLWIELIASDVAVSDILMMYINKQKENKPFPLQKSFIERILGLLKTNLDKWFKDYVNDYLTYFAIAGNKASSKFLKYDQEKTIALNEYADYVLDRINKRIEQLNATAVDCRNFTITKANGEEIRLTNGVLLGLDTIHRRSFATCKKDSQLRKVDTVVGFSSLKVYYDYKAVLSTMSVELAGRLVVSVDELIAYMRVTLTKDPENFDVIFDSIQIKPESLILTDHAAKIMGTFKHLLETYVLNFISNIIIYKIRMLHSMIKCEHTLEGYTSEQALEDGNEEEKMWLKT